MPKTILIQSFSSFEKIEVHDIPVRVELEHLDFYMEKFINGLSEIRKTKLQELANIRKRELEDLFIHTLNYPVRLSELLKLAPLYGIRIVAWAYPSGCWYHEHEGPEFNVASLSGIVAHRDHEKYDRKIYEPFGVIYLSSSKSKRKSMLSITATI